MLKNEAKDNVVMLDVSHSLLILNRIRRTQVMISK